MATGKRYYWLKLMHNFFEGDAISYLMDLPAGSNYIVLYLMLCLMTINTEGRLATRIGSISVRYDAAKLQREAKWFPLEFVSKALSIFTELGLVEQDKDGVLVIAGYSDMVGSETDWAGKKRKQRGGKSAVESLSEDIVPTGVPNGVQDNVTEERRDKSMETRDHRVEIERAELTTATPCTAEAVEVIIEAWNTLGLQEVKRIPSDKSRTGVGLRALIAEFGVNTILDVIEQVRRSNFLMGRTKHFCVTLSWLAQPDNFEKILAGNYDADYADAAPQATGAGALSASYSMMQGWVDSKRKEG